MAATTTIITNSIHNNVIMNFLPNTYHYNKHGLLHLKHRPDE